MHNFHISYQQLYSKVTQNEQYDSRQFIYNDRDSGEAEGVAPVC
jgi:hypothetical protein